MMGEGPVSKRELSFIPFQAKATKTVVACCVAFIAWIALESSVFGDDDSSEDKIAPHVEIGIRQGDIVEINGVLSSMDEARELIVAVRRARPDLELSVSGLKVNKKAESLPILQQVPDFLEELSITTHEWEMWVKSDEFLVSGQTDTVVTHAAFQYRLNLLRLENENLSTRNLICLVAREDLPETPRYLPEALLSSEEFFTSFPIVEEMLTDQSGDALIVSADPQLGEEIFKTPVVTHMFRLANLQLFGLDWMDVDSRELGLIVADRLNWLFIGENQVEPSGEAAVTPTQVAFGENTGQPAVGSASFSLRARQAMRARLEVIGQIPFSDQSFTVHLDQMKAIKEIATKLTADSSEGDVLLRSRVGGTGTDAFNEWVSTKRMDQVKDALVRHGIASERIEVELKAASSRDENPHHVDVLVLGSQPVLRAQPVQSVEVSVDSPIETGEAFILKKTDPIQDSSRVTLALPIRRGDTIEATSIEE